jgi:hypothetical protein
MEKPTAVERQIAFREYCKSNRIAFAMMSRCRI